MTNSPVSPTPSSPAGEMPLKALVAMVIAALGMMLAGLLGVGPFLVALWVVLADGVLALVVLLAAGGYGYALYRLFRPAEAPPMLAVATAAALGLWLLALAVLAVGTFGGLSGALWWPVVLLGAAAGLWQLHGPLGGVRLPRRLGGGSLVWVVVAAAAAIWLAGALMPAGWLGTLTGIGGDCDQVLGRYMQLPRAFHHAGRVTALAHNPASTGPLGGEMLRLLCMCLRGGPYEGMYLAKLTGLMPALLLVVAAAGGLSEDNFRARAATALLATAPWVVYLAGVALPEITWLCCLTLALLWLRRWLARPTYRQAVWIGAMLGAAVSAGWGAAFMVAAPVLVIMLVAAVRWVRCIRQVVLSAVVAAALAGPWLARHAATADRPAVPRARARAASSSPTSQDAAGQGLSVPTVITWRARLLGFLVGPSLASRWLGTRAVPIHTVLGAGVLLVLAGTLLGMLLRPGGLSDWDWALLGALAVQLAAWLAVGGRWGSSGRLASPSVVPISLLCAGGLARLAGVRQVRWLAQASGSAGRWGLAPAVLLLAIASAMNILSARAYWIADMGGAKVVPAGLPAEQLARHAPEFRAANALSKGDRLALIGDVRAFYFPVGAVYGMPPRHHPLLDAFGQSRSGQQLARRLRRKGITHLYVAWDRIERRQRAGRWPPELSAENLQRLLRGWTVVDECRFTPPTRPATAPAATAPAAPAQRICTLYAVPEAGPDPSSRPGSGPVRARSKGRSRTAPRPASAVGSSVFHRCRPKGLTAFHRWLACPRVSDKMRCAGCDSWTASVLPSRRPAASPGFVGGPRLGLWPRRRGS